jgi:small subunit ribosomal protein S20
MISRVLAFLCLAASAAAYSVVPARGAAPAVAQCVSRTAVVMSDAAPKKYKPTSFGVNPRVYKDRKLNLYNRYYKSTQATALKKLGAAIASGDKAAAATLLSAATSVIDKNVKRGIIHRNKGARNKSRWQKQLTKMDAPAPAAAAN